MVKYGGYDIVLEKLPGGDKVIYHLKWAQENIQLAQQVADAVRHNVEVELINAGYSPEGIRKMLAGLRVAANPFGVTVISTNKILNFLELGTRPRKMTYLLGKTVPIRTPWGLIFRKVTPMSLLRGAWRHPGTAPRRHIANVLREIAVQIVEPFARTVRGLVEQLRLAIRLG